MRIGMVCAASASAALLALAQSPPARSPYAGISGVVLNDRTGTPIRHATVTLTTLDTPPLDAVTFSESNGAFGFTNVPPGKYRLHVAMQGFQSAWFGAASAKRAPGTLTLAPGDLRFGMTFRLQPLGSIAGVAFDPDGDPLPNVQIRLLKSTFERRKPRYAESGWATSDERGRFRLSDLPAGQYVVMASQPFQTAQTIQPEVSGPQPPAPKIYSSQFYPGTNRLSAAEPVQVTPGKELEGIDFHLSANAAVRVHGTVTIPDPVTEDNQPSPGRGSYVSVVAIPQDVPESAQQTAGTGATAPEYQYEFTNLLPGPYVIVASYSAPNRDYHVAERVEVPAGGLELNLHLERGIELTGRVDFEGEPRPAEPFRVTLSSGDAPPVQSTPQVTAKPDGTFVIPNVLPGIWDINVEPVPKGGFIKSMRLGDEDVLTEDMTITPNTREPLRIVVSARGAVVTGTVTVPQGMARSPRASVLLAPSGKYEHVLSFYMLTPADESGHFEFTAITPGRYKLYAFEELEGASFEDPGFLKPYESSSEAFDIPEGGHVTRTIELIPANTVPVPAPPGKSQHAQ
ncbi:MAG: carboxypeptidase regulatory-like domain-containing protein [Bryobacteraceae bacterium]